MAEQTLNVASIADHTGVEQNYVEIRDPSASDFVAGQTFSYSPFVSLRPPETVLRVVPYNTVSLTGRLLSATINSIQTPLRNATAQAGDAIVKGVAGDDYSVASTDKARQARASFSQSAQELGRVLDNTFAKVEVFNASALEVQVYDEAVGSPKAAEVEKLVGQAADNGRSAMEASRAAYQNLRSMRTQAAEAVKLHETLRDEWQAKIDETQARLKADQQRLTETQAEIEQKSARVENIRSGVAKSALNAEIRSLKADSRALQTAVSEATSHLTGEKARLERAQGFLDELLQQQEALSTKGSIGVQLDASKGNASYRGINPDTVSGLQETAAKHGVDVSNLSTNTATVDAAGVDADAGKTPAVDTALDAGAAETSGRTTNVDGPQGLGRKITLSASNLGHGTLNLASNIGGGFLNATGKLIRVGAKGLPLVGAGLASTDAYAADANIQAAIDAGLATEEDRLKIAAASSTHIAQGGFDPSLFGGEIAVNAAYNLAGENLDVATLKMVRPGFLMEMVGAVDNDSFKQSDLETLRNKYTGAALDAQFAGIATRFGLPATIELADGNGASKEYSIGVVVRDENLLTQLSQELTAGKTAEQAANINRGLNALVFVNDTAAQANQILVEHDRTTQQSLARDFNHLTVQYAKESTFGWNSNLDAGEIKSLYDNVKNGTNMAFSDDKVGRLDHQNSIIAFDSYIRNYQQNGQTGVEIEAEVINSLLNDAAYQQRLEAARAYVNDPNNQLAASASPAAGTPAAGTPAGGSTTPAGGTTTPAGGATTPAGGATTPASGATTPASGATTPASGATTPAGGSTTPAGGSTTPAGGSATPAGGSTTPAGGPTTPAGGATTPAGGATTPAAPVVPRHLNTTNVNEASSQLQIIAHLAQDGGFVPLQGMTLSNVDGDYGRLTLSTTETILTSATVAPQGIPSHDAQREAPAKLQAVMDKIGNDPALAAAVVKGLQDPSNAALANEFLNGKSLEDFAKSVKVELPEPAATQTLVATVEAKPVAPIPLGDAGSTGAVGRRDVQQGDGAAAPESDVGLVFDRYTITGLPGDMPILTTEEVDIGGASNTRLDANATGLSDNQKAGIAYFENLEKVIANLEALEDTRIVAQQQLYLSKLKDFRDDIIDNGYEINMKAYRGLDYDEGEYSDSFADSKQYTEHDQKLRAASDANLTVTRTAPNQVTSLRSEFQEKAQDGYLTLEGGELMLNSYYQGAIDSGDSRVTHTELGARFLNTERFQEFLKERPVVMSGGDMDALVRGIDDARGVPFYKGEIEKHGVMVKLGNNAGYLHVEQANGKYEAQFVSNAEMKASTDMQNIYGHTPPLIRTDYDDLNESTNLKAIKAGIHEHKDQIQDGDHLREINRDPRNSERWSHDAGHGAAL